MQHTPWTVRSADWPVTSKMTLALIAKDIEESLRYFENLASAGVNEERSFGLGVLSTCRSDRTGVNSPSLKLAEVVSPTD